MGLFFYNTDGNNLERCRLLMDHQIAATSGPRRFGEQLRQLSPDDGVLMYANGHGIIAAGRVLANWEGKTHKRPKFYAGLGVDDLGEYRIEVDWTDDWIDDPISLEQLQIATGNLFTPRGAVRRIVKHRLEIEQMVAARSQDGLPVPAASDVEPPVRVEVTINRIVRDTACSRKIKRIHRHKCQLCGNQLRLRDGAYYAEAHHIRPLGGTHKGLDIERNVICVCPNHHALLDYGAIRLTASSVQYFGKGHSIDRDSIEYHNSEIYKSR